MEDQREALYAAQQRNNTILFPHQKCKIINAHRYMQVIGEEVVLIALVPPGGSHQYGRQTFRNSDRIPLWLVNSTRPVAFTAELSTSGFFVDPNHLELIDKPITTAV